MLQDKLQFANLLITVLIAISVILFLMLQRSYNNHLSKDITTNILKKEILTIECNNTYKSKQIKLLETLNSNKNNLINNYDNEIIDLQKTIISCNYTIDRLTNRFEEQSAIHKQFNDKLFKNKFLKYVRDYKKLLNQTLITNEQIDAFKVKHKELFIVFDNNILIFQSLHNYNAFNWLNPNNIANKNLEDRNKAITNLSKLVFKLKQ